MKRFSVSIFILLLLPILGHAGSNLRTIIKDNGDTEKENVDGKKNCNEIVEAQQRLLIASNPEFKGLVTLKEAIPIEVYRSNSTFGYAVKCVLKFPSK